MEKIKSLFATPARTAATILESLLVIAVLGTGIAVAAVYLDYQEERIEQSIMERLYGNGAVPEAPASEAPQDIAEAPAQDQQDNSVQATPPAQSEAQSAQKISAEQAENAALKDAGFARSDVDNIYSHFEMDDGFYQYEVHIYKGEYEYEYTISADDGRIFEKDVDFIFD